MNLRSFSWLAAWVVALHIVVWAPQASGQGPVLPLPATDQQELAKYLGAGVVGAALPSETIADATVYFPLADKTFNYQVTSGSNAGTSQNLGLKQSQTAATSQRSGCSIRLGRCCVWAIAPHPTTPIFRRGGFMACVSS